MSEIWTAVIAGGASIVCSSITYLATRRSESRKAATAAIEMADAQDRGTVLPRAPMYSGADAEWRGRVEDDLATLGERIRSVAARQNELEGTVRDEKKRAVKAVREIQNEAAELFKRLGKGSGDERDSA